MPASPVPAPSSPLLPPGPTTTVAASTSGAAVGPSFPRDHVTLRPWSDPLLDRHGHDPRSSYAERFWLPVLGPSTLLLLRRLVAELERAAVDREPEVDPVTGPPVDRAVPRCRVAVADLAAALGMGGRRGPSPAFLRTVDRVVSFGFAQLVDADTFAVRTHLPTLTRRQLGRLTATLRAEHERWPFAPATDPVDPAQVRRRARALALSLLELGEDRAGTERQLHLWRFHPAVAHDAVRWAGAEHAARQRAHGDAPHEARGDDAA